MSNEKNYGKSGTNVKNQSDTSRHQNSRMESASGEKDKTIYRPNVRDNDGMTSDQKAQKTGATLPPKKTTEENPNAPQYPNAPMDPKAPMNPNNPMNPNTPKDPNIPQSPESPQKPGTPPNPNAPKE